MKREELLRAMSDIDEKIVEQAADALAGRKRLRVWQKAALIAACVALMLCAGNLALRMQAVPGKTFFNSEKAPSSLSFGGMEPLPPELPWDDSLSLKISMETCSYRPDETAALRIEAWLKDDVLGSGDLHIRFSDDFFSISYNGAAPENGCIVIADFTADNYGKDTPLVLTVQLKAPQVRVYGGTLGIGVNFVPADMGAFWESMTEHERQNISSYGWYAADMTELPLENCGIYYAIDPLELRFRGRNSRYGLMSDLLSDHLITLQISGKEFVDLHYDYAYRDHITVARTSYMDDGRFRVEYISKNIRWQSQEFIQDEALWQLFEQLEQYDLWEDQNDPEMDALYRQAAEALLERMVQSGVITQSEYEAELLWIRQAGTVSNMFIAYSENRWQRVFSFYRYTH